jgi:hypothetical protein
VEFSDADWNGQKRPKGRRALRWLYQDRCRWLRSQLHGIADGS